MPYFVSSIIAIVSAMIILTTRYESDNSNITAELDKMKSMFLTVSGFVDTYVMSGADLRVINFEGLYNSGILLENIIKSTPSQVTDNVKGVGISSTLTFPKNTVVWHLIPNKNIPGSYKLLVDMRANSGLMSKAIFSETFSAKEFCEELLIGTVERKTNKFLTDDFINDGRGTEDDGIFVCIISR